jgi:hypothetical protein
MDILQESKALYEKIRDLLIDKMTIKLQLENYDIEEEDVTGDNTNDYSVETIDES